LKSKFEVGGGYAAIVSTACDHSVDLDKLILSIHAGCLSEDSWAQVVGDLCRTFNARGAALVRPIRDPHFQPLATLFEFDATFARQYAEYWGPHDVWYQGATRTGRMGVGLVNAGDHLIDYQNYRKSAFFNEYLKPMDIDRMMTVSLVGPDSGYAATNLSLYRALGKDAFSAQEIGLLSRLAPHLGVAIQNYSTIRSIQLLSRARGNALDAVTSAVFGLEPSGRVAFMNQTAEELLRRGRWVQVANGTLGPAKGLLEAIEFARALRLLPTGISFKLVGTERMTGNQAVMSGAPLGDAHGSLDAGRVSCLVLLTPIVADVDAAADLAKLYGLTLAEKRLVAELIARENLREAAARLHISLHTARTQLKSVFAKTGRRTQAALLTFVARLSSLRTPSRTTDL
jgi:DNA-binding CsgD family transcriptional regulator